METLLGIIGLLAVLLIAIAIVAPAGCRGKIGHNPVIDDIDKDEYYKLLNKKII